MKYRYTKFTGDALDELDLEDLVAKLSDLLLSSGFGSPYAMDDDERTMQALHDAILDALFNGGVLPEETIEKLLGDPADGDQADARSKLEELIQQIIERMGEQGYITTPPDLEAEREHRGESRRRSRRSRRSSSRSPTRRSTSSATARCATCSARSARAASAATTRASRRRASRPPAPRSRTSSATRSTSTRRARC